MGKKRVIEKGEDNKKEGADSSVATIAPKKKKKSDTFASRNVLREEHNDDDVPDTDPDWSQECNICGMAPIVPITGMCGPCTWGEAETIGGNW